MADEATLTIRFKDETDPSRAGAGGRSAQQAVGDIPGSSQSADFHAGLGQAAGQARAANEAAGQLPTLPSLPEGTGAAPVPDTGAAPISQPKQTGDDLLNAVREMLKADPSIKREELQSALGINAGRAQSLLDAALGKAKPETPPMAAPPDAGTVPQPPVSEGLPQPPPLTDDQRLTEAERRAPPVINPPEAEPKPPDVKAALQTAASVAGQIPGMGQFGSILNKAAAIPGVGAMEMPGGAAVMPALAAAAMPVGAALAAAGIVTAGAAALNNEVDRARGLAGSFSPELAGAEAEARVRQLVANMRTAEILGDEAASVVESRSRLSAAMQGTRDVVAEPLMRDFAAATKLLADAAEGINAFTQRNREVFDVVGQNNVSATVTTMFGPLGRLFLEMTRLNDNLEKNKPDTGPFNYWQNQPHVPLPAGFTDSGMEPLEAAEFSPVPGLTL